MRVLVTGAQGFVGPHLVRALQDSGHDVVATARSGTDPALDVEDPESCRAAVRRARPDAVCHLAGLSHVQASAPDLYRANAVGTLNLLDAVAAEAPDARTLLASSAYVYGRVPRSAQPVAETHPPDPANHYGASKLAAEAVARVFAKQGLDVVVARAFNHVGPGQAPGFLVPDLLGQVVARVRGAEKGPVRMRAREPVRDFLDVRDVCRAYTLLVESPEAEGVYNVASGRGIAVGELADELVRLAGLGAKVETTREPRAGEVDALVGDPSRLAALGWSPKLSLEETLRWILDDALNG